MPKQLLLQGVIIVKNKGCSLTGYWSFKELCLTNLPICSFQTWIWCPLKCHTHCISSNLNWTELPSQLAVSSNHTVLQLGTASSPYTAPLPVKVCFLNEAKVAITCLFKARVYIAGYLLILKLILHCLSSQFFTTRSQLKTISKMS